MTIFTVIEMTDVELTGVSAFSSREEADAHFERLLEADGAPEWAREDMQGEIEGTLRLAGDDAYSVHLLETPLQ